MGLSQNHVRGQDQKLYMVKESTAGTFIKAATGHAANGRLSIVPNIERKDRKDAFRSSRDITERLTGKSNYAWSYEGLWVPSGTKNTAPDIGDLILAAMGSETVNANDVTYALTSTQAFTTLSMTRHFGNILQEALAGCWVDELKMAFGAGEEPKVSASGGAMTYAATGVSTLNGAMSASQTMVVDDANFAQTNASAAGVAGAGAASVVKIDADDNSGTGFLVTVDSAAPSFTIEANATGSDGATVIPFVPTYSLTGSPVSGVSGTFTWDSFSAVLTALEFSLKNNVAPFSDEAFTQHVRDAGIGDREITGSMTFRVRKDHLIHILNRKAFATKALSLIVGGADQSGTRLTVTMGQCEMEFGEISAPEEGEATINATFKALGSSGNDALTLKHS